jgi:hypothetical protein
MASPVASSDALYSLCGRVFPDPLASAPGPALPGESPYAKGNRVCRATTFIAFDEALAGLRFLEQRYPRFVQVFNLRTDFASVLDLNAGEGQTAGLPSTTLGREKSDIYMVRITDERVPESQKKNFLFTLSMHGIERAGIEGGLRAAEDLATWGAESPKQPVMETDSTSIPVGQVLQKSSVWFALSNPDGWRRGDISRGGPAFQRYNGNGVDLNRDWPEKGFTFRPYTPASEPETATFAKVLKKISPKWAGGVDLHGQLIDRAFSFTLLGASQRPFDKNQRMLQFTRGAYQDAEKRLAWNPLIKPNDAPPACVEPSTGLGTNDPPDCDPLPRLYGVQFGSIWDTIAYTVTGAIGDWADSDLGLDADFIDNEMSLSHLINCGTGNCYIPQAEQLHVDGNKSLIYAMLNYTLLPEDTSFQYEGKVAYLTHDHRITNPGHPAKPASTLPVQDPLSTTLVKLPGQEAAFEFDVLPASKGRANGGLKAKATFSNVQGAGPGAVLGLAVDRLNAKEPEPDGSQWTTVNQDYNQAPTYVQSGMQVDANDLTPGHYRVRITGEGAAAITLAVTFTRGQAWPDPGQKPYDVSNLDFFTDLAKFAPKGRLVGVPLADVVAGKADLQQYDTVVVVDGVAQRDKRLPAKLTDFARKGGNLVLTDDALNALVPMGLLPKGTVKAEPVYAGSVRFQAPAGSDDPYGAPLAKGIHEPGAAEGPNHRKQTQEPVPTGYSIQDADGNDKGSVPQTGVDPAAWAKAGGVTVGTTGDGSANAVTYGELKVGQGRVRILGSLLPVPTEKYDHPFGLSSYAVTTNGYAIFRNLVNQKSPNRTTGAAQQPVAGPPAEEPGPMPATGGSLLLATGGGVLLGAGLLLLRRRLAS